MNQIDLVGRHAVVTGGAQGLGLAMAKRFLQSGARVTLWDLDEKRLENAVEELGDKAIGGKMLRPKTVPAARQRLTPMRVMATARDRARSS